MGFSLSIPVETFSSLLQPPFLLPPSPPPPCSNDAFDSATGVDRTKRESVVNLTGGKQGLVLLLANLFLLAGAGLLTRLVASAANGQAAGMLVAAIACGYLYQGPPFRCAKRASYVGGA